MSSIDVNLFMVQSSRGASSSAADTGITTTDILKAGNWSTEEVLLLL